VNIEGRELDKASVGFGRSFEDITTIAVCIGIKFGMDEVS
jgi:hypothetical protein